MMCQERTVTDLDHWLGPELSLFPKTCATAAAQDQNFHGDTPRSIAHWLNERPC
jgi:hypothetical protein